MASTQEHSRGSSEETKVSIRGECNEDGCVPSGGLALLSHWFLVRSVLELERSIFLSSPGCVKSAVGRNMELISTSDTTCIIYSSLVCPVSSGVMDKIIVEFPVSLTYSESPSPPPKLAVNVKSLSGSTGNLGVAS